MKNMNKAYRHGENLLLVIDSIPEEAVKLNTNIFATGSHGHNHSITGGSLYKSGETLYLEAKETSLLHPEHSPNTSDAKIIDGFYQIISQVEYTPDGLKPVVD
jgi:hypothetical protein